MVLARMWFYSFNGNIILRFWREISFCSFRRKCVFYDFGGKNRFMVLAEKMTFWEENAIYDFGGKLFGLQFWRENAFLRFWQKIVFFFTFWWEMHFGRKNTFFLFFARKYIFAFLTRNYIFAFLAGKWVSAVLAGKWLYTGLVGKYILQFW